MKESERQEIPMEEKKGSRLRLGAALAIVVSVLLRAVFAMILAQSLEIVAPMCANPVAIS